MLLIEGLKLGRGGEKRTKKKPLHLLGGLAVVEAAGMPLEGLRSNISRSTRQVNKLF